MNTAGFVHSRLNLMLRWGAVAVALLPSALAGQLRVLTNETPQLVFGGGSRNVRLLIRNALGNPIDATVRFQVFQASSATAMPAGPLTLWKRLNLLPGQTVVESAIVPFPEVRSVTSYLVKWSDANGRGLGNTAMIIYPTNLLAELRPLAGGRPVGVLDPLNRLKPLLRMLSVDLEDLEKRDLEFFAGPLAILGPFASANQMSPNLDKTVQDRARGGMAIVWIQPPPEPNQRADEPKNFLLCTGRGAVFLADSEAVAGLNENPEAQLNLIRFARLALKVDQLKLPKLNL